MNKKYNYLFYSSFLGLLVVIGFGSIFLVYADEPPTQEALFNSHTFSENYWDIMVSNNSNWDHPDVDPMVSWLNNTWNVKWIKEDNFEMGMFAFMNKTQWDMGQQNVFTTPAQMWWQHAHIAGSEIIVATMHSAWYGFGDLNHNRVYDEGTEELNPYFFMGGNTYEVRNTGLISDPKTTAYPMTRSVSGSVINYSWGYKYENIIFFVPNINRTDPMDPSFNWGFNYSDPGTYVHGSHHIGNMTYFEYLYTLEIDTSAGISTLHQDYETGEINAMVYRDNEFDSWAFASYPDDHWVPEHFAMCLGTYSFIWAKQDWALSHLGGAINRTLHESGLSIVETYLGGIHAFDFRFSQKPEYTLTNKSNLVTGTYNVSYECLDVDHDPDFLKLVSGMTELVGEFGRLVIAYAINQTNTFIHGIPMEEAYNETDPENNAAFFVSCYPEYGAYGGGGLSHDPVFVMYFTASGAIPGFPFIFLLSSLTIGIAVVIMRLKKK